MIRRLSTTLGRWLAAIGPLIVFALVMACGPARAQDCYSASIQAPTLNYNGVSAAETTATLTLRRINLTNLACTRPAVGTFRLELTANGPNGENEWSSKVNGVEVGAFVPSLSWSLLTPRTFIWDGHWFEHPLTWSGETATFPVTFRIAAGQTAQAGTATLQVAWQIDTDFRRKGPTSALTVTVPPTLELSITGLTTGAGATTGSIEFGSFADATATSRALSIRALATTAFHIEVESVQGGALRRTTSCATTAAVTNDAAEQLAYSVDINGSPVTPAPWSGPIGAANRYSHSTNTNAAPNQRLILPVTVTVPAFDLATRRAGQFCDTVRMRLRAQ